MDENDANDYLNNFSGPDEEAAGKALNRLRRSSEKALRSFLIKNYGPERGEEFEDAVQKTFIKVWMKRRSFVNQGYAAWHGYLQTVARRCLLDIRLPSGIDLASVDLDDIPEHEIGVILGFLDEIDRQDVVERIFHAADVLWLGLDETLPRALHRRQVLAAKLFYLDGMSWEEVLDHLGTGTVDGAPLTRPVLDSWLEHEGVIRGMAYDELFYSGDRLAWHLLGKPEPVESESLDALIRQASREAASKSDRGSELSAEVVVILWRYRMGMQPDLILKRAKCVCSLEELESILDSLAIRLPFSNQMKSLLSGLKTVPGARAVEILQCSGLWKRLAFQYDRGEDLTLSDVYERLAPAAEPIQYKINKGMLNIWLSKRLIEQLANYFAKTRKAEADG